MKIYVTKYALTQGIFTIEAESVDDWKYAAQKESPRYFLGRGDFAFTEEEALKKAEELRFKKLKSLNKSIKKIYSIEFEVV